MSDNLLRRTSLACLLGLLAPAVQAIEAEEGDAVAELPPLVVTAVVKPPLGAAEIDMRNRPNASASTSDAASLLREAGVSINGAGGISSLPSIRGLADDRLRIKVDGLDLLASCPNHMNPPLSYVDPSNLGTLKVFAGITPVSVGGDSIGGTIVAESLRPEFAATGETLDKGSVSAYWRSNNDARGGNLSLMHANDVFNIRYAGSYSKANNYMAGGDFKTTTATGRPGETSALDEVASTAYETRSHQLSMAYRLGEDLLELTVARHEVPQELFPNQRMDLTDNTQDRVSLRYLSSFDWGRLETQIYHETVEHVMNFGPDKQLWYGDALGMPMNSDGKTLGASIKAEIDLTSSDLLRVGSEYQRYRLDDYWPASGTGSMSPDTFENINDGERDRLALFGEWEREIDPAWLTLVGLRYEHVSSRAGQVHGYGNMMGSQIPDAAAFNASDRSQTDHNWDFTALARYTHDASLDVEFGYARKVRSPNLYERYTWSTWTMAAVMNNFVGDGNGYVGNVDLEPETAHTLSATFDWHSRDRRHELKVTPFYTHVDGYIDAVARPGWTAGQFNVLEYANQSARIYGVDVKGRLPLVQNALGQWGLESQVNYSNGTNRDTGDALYNLMPLNATLAVTQALGGWKNRLEMVSVKAKTDGSEVRQEIETPGYTLFNLRLSHAWDRVSVDMGIENLADKFYYLPTGGTYTAQGRTMSINGIPFGIAVPGMGRTLYTGVTVNF